tara:strand:- start:1124 stop:1837 length:714 start_codon:yes stop_codon:yes gene_type:complete
MRKQIPTLEELREGKIVLNTFEELLESDPPAEWLRVHPLAKNEASGEPVRYLPIERVDYLLRSLFSGHWLEVMEVNVFQRSVSVTVRLFYVDPIDGKVKHSDGVGGFSSVGGFDSAVAIAESNGKKSAAKKLGKIFGRDLSRDYNEKTEDKIEGKVEVKIEIEAENEIEKLPAYNPAKERILKQIKATKTKRGFTGISNAILKRVEMEEINDDEFTELTNALIERAEKLGVKSNLEK